MAHKEYLGVQQIVKTLLHILILVKYLNFRLFIILR